MPSLIVLKRRLHNLSISKVVLVIVLLTVFFNEFLVYSIQSLKWMSIPTRRNVEEEMVILFVADPQLIGIQDEMRFPIGAIARWDSDRYLRKTFSRAYSHTQPDAIVYLGDIMDEGSKATAQEYLSYVDRFKYIFYENRFSKAVIIPGDNDVGGEGADFRTPFKVARFEKHFESIQGSVNVQFVDFVKLDIRHHYSGLEEKRQAVKDMYGDFKALHRILINHEGVTTKRKENIYYVLKDLQPSIIMSAHWHWSVIHSCETCLSDDASPDHWPVHQRDTRNSRGFEEFDLTKPHAIHEIMVPTCSYRMGVPNMGYGVAILKKSGQLKYTVLWLPSRYIVLYFYVGVLIFASVLLLIEFIFSSSKSSHISPYTHQAHSRY